MQLLPGYDYTLVKGKEIGAVERSRPEWQALLREGLAHGGHRRVENGETFLHDRTTRIVFEIYANVRV